MGHKECDLLADPKLQEAVSELKEMIASRYPSATFKVSRGEDPEGIYLTPTVDVADTEEVFDIVVKRLLQMQIDAHLPVYVVPIRSVEHVLEDMRSSSPQRPDARVWEEPSPLLR
jgi:hypothetical protein